VTADVERLVQALSSVNAEYALVASQALSSGSQGINSRRPIVAGLPQVAAPRCAGRFHLGIGSILTEIYLCHACSCQEILRMETAGQGAGRQHPPRLGTGKHCAPPPPSAHTASRPHPRS
jgi:hypothetical protein